MATVTVSQQIAAPVGQVFKLFTDIAHAPEHVSGIKKLELMTPGPVGLRTRWIETREVMGRLDTAEMEITGVRAQPDAYNHASQSRRAHRHDLFV